MASKGADTERTDESAGPTRPYSLKPLDGGVAPRPKGSFPVRVECVSRRRNFKQGRCHPSVAVGAPASPMTWIKRVSESESCDARELIPGGAAVLPFRRKRDQAVSQVHSSCRNLLVP